MMTINFTISRNIQGEADKSEKFALYEVQFHGSHISRALGSHLWAPMDHQLISFSSSSKSIARSSRGHTEPQVRSIPAGTRLGVAHLAQDLLREGALLHQGGSGGTGLVDLLPAR